MLLLTSAAAVVLTLLLPVGGSPARAVTDRSVAAIVPQVATAADDAYLYEVITIPALAGVDVTLDGVTHTTSATGRTIFRIPRVNGEVDDDVGNRLTVDTTELQLDERTIARYARPVPRAKSMTLMFSRFYRTEFTFTDANDRTVPNNEIGDISLKSSTGEVLEIAATDETWLLGSRVAGSTKPEVKQVFWTINDILVDEASVAHRGQTKFFPEDEPVVASTVLLFDLSFRVVDAFFGNQAGNAITIDTPSGERIHLDLVDGAAELIQLPRGEYQVIIEGSGLRIGRPVTLTRNQDVRLLYYTRLDIALVIVVLSAFLVLPFLIGRKRHKARDRRAQAAESAPDVEDEAIEVTITVTPQAEETELEEAEPGEST